MKKLAVIFAFCLILPGFSAAAINPSNVDLTCNLDLSNEEVNIELDYSGDSSGSVEIYTEAGYGTAHGTEAKLSSSKSQASVDAILPTPEPTMNGGGDYNTYAWIKGGKSETKTYCGTYDINTMEEEDREPSGYEKCNVQVEVKASGSYSSSDQVVILAGDLTKDWIVGPVGESIGDDGTLSRDLGQRDCNEDYDSSSKYGGVKVQYESGSHVYSETKDWPDDDENNILKFNFNIEDKPTSDSGQDSKDDNQCTYDIFGEVQGVNTPLTNSEKGSIEIEGRKEEISLADDGSFGTTFAGQCIDEEREVRYVKNGKTIGSETVDFPSKDSAIENILIEIQKDRQTEEEITIDPSSNSNNPNSNQEDSSQTCDYTLSGRVEGKNSGEVHRKSNGDFTTIDQDGSFGTELDWTTPAECGSQLTLQYQKKGEIKGTKTIDLPSKSQRIKNIVISPSSSQSEKEINNPSIIVESKEGLKVELRTNVEASGGIGTISWDLNNDGEYEKEGRTVSKEFNSGGEKTIKLKVAKGSTSRTTSNTVTLESSETEGNPAKESEPSMSLNTTQLRAGETVKISTENLGVHRIVIIGPKGHEVAEIAAKKGPVFTYQVPEDATQGAYKVEALRDPQEGFLSKLGSSISNAILGATISRKFEVLPPTPDWISYCNSLDYQIQSANQNPEASVNCIEEEIVPKYFEGDIPEDTSVAQNLCQDLLEYEYSRDEKRCVE